MLNNDDFTMSALLDERLIDHSKAERARAHAAEKNVLPSDALAELGLLDARTIAMVRAQTCECPFVDPGGYDIAFENAERLPRGVAESCRAFPLFVLGNVVTVGMVDPLDLRAVDLVRSALRCDVEPVLCEPAALSALIERAYALTAGSAVARPVSLEFTAATPTGKEPIVAAVNEIIAQGVDLGASDIHIGPDENELHLRYRVDGTLRSVRGPGLDSHTGIMQRLKVMADLDLTQSRRPQDGKFRFSHFGREIDIRVSLLPTVCGENAVLRLLSTAASIRGFADLGFPQDMTRQFETLIEQPYGMLLVTGPTGSGKTTTLYTALKRLNAPDVNIMTIEDPVEIRMPMIRQVQVNSGLGMTFAGALRSILRQDPDVVFVGEIRDEETARISVQAALTGHLVLSSLHTNDAAGAIPRLRDLGCPTFAINAAVLGIIAQRLARKTCPDCVRPYDVSPGLLARFGIAPGEHGFVRGVGCARCGNQGLRGRVGLYEMLMLQGLVRDAVEAEGNAQAIQRAAESVGFRTMAADGIEKARLGMTTLEEVARVVTVLGDDGPDALPGEETRAAA